MGEGGLPGLEAVWWCGLFAERAPGGGCRGPASKGPLLRPEVCFISFGFRPGLLAIFLPALATIPSRDSASPRGNFFSQAREVSRRSR